MPTGAPRVMVAALAAAVVLALCPASRAAGDAGAQAFLMGADAATAMVAADGTATDVKCPLTPRPIQLVRPAGPGPDPKLEVAPEAIKFLNSLTVPLHVVGVVGPFHSGKSFLLNRIMDQELGFTTGKTVDPTTKGIWAWGVPATLPGAKFAVLFVDTEGFAASDVTGDYDAKIFAVSSLFSSYLLYNSVQNIDQNAIDYLELLARRTQLFQLKTAVSEQGGTAALDPEQLFPLPTLTWVVEDFFMNTVSDETPTQWLHRLLNKPRKDGASGSSGIREIFPEVNCHTLYLPTLSQTGLADVSSVPRMDLTPEFIDGVAELSSNIIENLKNLKSTRGGPNLAALLQVLVKSINEGTLSEIPSLWQLFVEKQLREAIDAAGRCFAIGINKYGEHTPPYTMEVFAKKADDLVARCGSVFRSMLVGVANNTAEHSRRNFASAIGDERVEKETKQRNAITRYCNSMQSDAKDTLGKALHAVNLPTRTDPFKKQMTAHAKALLETYTADVKVYKAQCSKQVAALEVGLREAIASILNKNNEQHRQRMDACVKIAHEQYKELAEDKLGALDADEALTAAEVKAFDTMATAAAKGTFDSQCAGSKDEKDFPLLEGTVTSNRPFNAFQSRNFKRIQRIADAAGDHVGQDLTRALLAAGPLPMALTEVETIADAAIAGATARFNQLVSRFAETKQVEAARDELKGDMADAKDNLKKRNDQAWQRVFHRPLKIARELLVAEAKSSWSSFLLRRRAYDIAAGKITESAEGRRVAPKQLERVVQSWLDKPKVKEVIASVDMWQNIIVGGVIASLVALLMLCAVGRK